MKRRTFPQARRAPVLVHLTTVDMSLELLLGPQLRAFKAAGYDVVTMSAPGPYVAKLEADGLRHVPLHSSTRAMSLRSDLRAFVELFRTFRELRPEIVHTHNPKPGVYGRVAARLAGVPLVVNTVHGLYAQPTDPLLRRTVVYTLERFAASFSHVEFIQNEEDLATLRSLKVRRRKLRLFGNGVDLGRFQPDAVEAGTRQRLRAELGIAEDEVVACCVARLVNDKGIPELVEAAVRLRRTNPQLRFLLVGPHDTGSDDCISEETLEAARAAGMVLTGRRNDVVELLAASDIFVLPSHREGFPRSVMEAASMGLPTIATDIRGCRQAVISGTTGELVPVQDVDRLVDALDRLASDPVLRAEMAINARRLAGERFDVRSQIDQCLAEYRTNLDPEYVAMLDSSEAAPALATADALVPI